MNISRVLFSIIVFSLLCNQMMVGQPLTSLSVAASGGPWSHTYGGVDYDIGQSVIPVSTGGYIIAGYTQSFSVGYIDLWLVRINDAGHLLWHRNHGTPWGGIHGDEYSGQEGAIGLYSIVECQDGGFAVAGQTWANADESINDAWLIRVNEEGHHLWNFSYGAENEDWGNDLIELSDGGFLIVGFFRSAPFYVGQLFMVRTDRNGNQLWNQTHGGPRKEAAYSVVQCQDGGFAVVGYMKEDTPNPSIGPADVWLLRTDSDGLQLWNRTYGGDGDDQGFSVIECGGGGFAIAGYTENADDRDMWLLRTDATGTHQWNQSFGGTDVDQGHSLIEYSQGGFTIAGFSISEDSGYADMFIVGTDENGNQQWSRLYGGVSDDFASSLVETNTGDLVVAGSTKSYGAGAEDMWVLRVPPNSPQPAFSLQIEQLLAFAIMLAVIPALAIAFFIVHRRKR